MARAVAAAVLALAVCCLLVAPAPARRPVDLPPLVPDAFDREAAAEPLLPKPVAVAGAAEAVEQGTALAAPEEQGTAVAVREEEPQRLPSLLCLVFRCGGEPAGSSEETAELDGWVRPEGKAEVDNEEVDEVEDEQDRPYDSDSDSDWDSDSDDEDDGGIVGWFWKLAHLF
ncbi:hypothetical protein ACP70R_030910 [Stipagrostis hirtigluma subsp. patula]